MTAFYYFFY